MDNEIFKCVLITDAEWLLMETRGLSGSDLLKRVSMLTGLSMNSKAFRMIVGKMMFATHPFDLIAREPNRRELS